MKKSQIHYSRGYLPYRYPKRYRPACWRDRERKEISWKKRIIFLLVLLLILGFTYFLFFSPIFEIKEIKISGNRIVTSEEIRDSLNNFLSKKFLIFFDKNNIFLIRKSKLEEIVLKDFSRISSIEVNKNVFKRIIDFKIVERKEVGIFCRNEPASPEPQRGECYYIDKDGVIFEKAPQTSGTLILSIKDYSSSETEIGKNVIDKEFMVKLIDLGKSLAEQLGLKVLDFIIEAESKDLKINTNEGWYILFDKSRDFKDQLDALRLVLEEKIKGERKKLEYIDLRIENRAYYK